jgi:hypothetical protein
MIYLPLQNYPKLPKTLRVNSFTAWVTVDGDDGNQKASIYSIGDDEFGVTGWIASKEGQVILYFMAETSHRTQRLTVTIDIPSSHSRWM